MDGTSIDLLLRVLENQHAIMNTQHVQGLVLEQVAFWTCPQTEQEITGLAKKLKDSHDALEKAIRANQPSPNKEKMMANPTLDALAAQVTANLSVEGSAVVLINGIAARVQAAVDAAVAGGASAADLAPVVAEVASLKASADALSAAVAANTPVNPNP